MKFKVSEPADLVGGLLLFIGLLLTTPIYAINPSDISIGIEHSLKQDYDAALAVFARLETAFPHRPEPVFYKASVLQTRMMDFETQQWEAEFLDAIETTVDKADKCLKKNPKDLDALFARGAAKSYKSFYLGRNGNYLQSLLWARQGMGDLETVMHMDSSYLPVYLGMGSYLYWKSRLTQNLTWLPFLSDQREKGIDYLKKVAHSNTLGHWSAVSNLCWIYIEEKNYEKALCYARMGVQAFPDSRFFLWPYGDTLFLLGHFPKAIQVYRKLLYSVKQESFNNRYNETVLYLKLGKCYHSIGEYETAREYLKQVLDMNPEPDVLQRCRRKKDQAYELLQTMDIASE